ncbi:PH domain-containing protein [Xanthomonadaceae bacterium JHOS43]|nr:PH domain-containing protein [Xanthomonadaceae bacterium JHOS43]MCX7564535.1 PH domain-containing protein [Xanthomonadaceae bacterium XH05]
MLDSDQTRLGAGHERRLHPLSWMFVLLLQIKGFALPLIALLVFGRNEDSWQWWGLIAVALMTLAAVAQYFTYRFRIDADELVIRSGLFQRNVRHVPLARIQSVALHRNLLHQIAGVAEVRLESAVGGDEPEAQMRVLSMADAAALERVIEHRRGAARAVVAAASGDAPAMAMPGAPDAPATQVLLQLPLLELLKLGLASNRGTVLLAAGAGALMQFGGEVVFEKLGDWPRQGLEWLTTLGVSLLVWATLGLVILLLAVIAGRVLGIVLTLLAHFRFTLEQAGPRVSVERGLLTRIRASAPLRRIQHWTLRQGVVLRLFGRSSLRVETAALRMGNEEQTVSELVPVASPDTLDALLRRWLPEWPGQFEFRPLHPRAWRRLCLAPCILTLGASAVLLHFIGLKALFGLALVPFWVWLARQQARAAGYAVEGDFLVWRSGWLDRRISFTRIEKLQGLRLVQSPFDRRHGMASLNADTAGAHPLGHRLHLIHLPESEARALYRRLATHLARTPWQW